MVHKAVGDLKGELEHGGCVDWFMRDQLVVFQALAGGCSEVTGGAELSLHAQTAQWVACEMLGVKFNENGACEGVGWAVGTAWKRRTEISKT
jgi:RNA 3'-terminal phosphate cyclase (ATP)